MQSIKVELGERNRSRLEAKQYSQGYTNVPNSVLPDNLVSNLNVIYSALSGEQMPNDAHTFTVKAEGGEFKRLYGPTLVKNSESNELCVKWGGSDIPLEIVKNKLKPANSDAKVRFSFKDEKISDKLTLTFFVVTVVSADKIAYVMDIGVIPADLKNPTRSEVFDILLEDDPSSIANNIGSMGEGGERLQGPIIKAAHLPLGNYKVTGYKSYDNSQYGTQYSLQVFVPDGFEAPVNHKNDKGEWEPVDTRIEGYAQVKANSYLKSRLKAGPIISEEKPAELKVKEHGEYNGHPTAKVELSCAEYSEEEDCLSMSF